MLIEEGLDPTFNQYPSVDGEAYNEAIVWFPFMQIGMFGPDEGLTTISLAAHAREDGGLHEVSLGGVLLSARPLHVGGA